ncbi:dephospho-CoA kinase [Bacillus paranthracis]|uniref:dephospho-CoA kinase n=1 Tax=Bacillus paranthracis TaxID=2026186 RepID=UPI0037C9984A
MAQLTPIKLSLNNYIAGSGKSTIASYLVEKHGFVVYNFADKIYELAEELFGMKIKDRNLLIAIGEKLREIDKMVWIKETLKRIEAEGNPRIVIADTRKLIEFAYLLEHGYEQAMVFCPEEVALQRLRERDGEDNVNEDVVLNGATENQLRPLIDTMKVFNTSTPLEETLSEVDIYIKSLERKISKK